MKTKLALYVAAAAFLTACAGAPTWDTNVFPQQPMYEGATSLSTQGGNPGK